MQKGGHDHGNTQNDDEGNNISDNIEDDDDIYHITDIEVNVDKNI